MQFLGKEKKEKNGNIIRKINDLMDDFFEIKVDEIKHRIRFYKLNEKKYIKKLLKELTPLHRCFNIFTNILLIHQVF